jgi:hypothetical protein
MSAPEKDSLAETRWTSPRGETIACVEKLKVLRTNLDEIRQIAQDALDDAVLLGCDAHQYRAAIVDIVRSLESAYAERNDGATAPDKPA